MKCVKHAYRRHYLRRTQNTFGRSFLQERLSFISLFEIKSIFWHQNPKISRVILHRKGRSHRGQCREEHCLQWQELKLYWLQRLKGVPPQGRQDWEEIPRGYQMRTRRIFNLLAPLRNLMTRSCFPTDLPSTASWCAAIAATYTLRVEGDSLRSNPSCRKESTTAIGHLRGSSRRGEHQSTNRFHFSL